MIFGAPTRIVLGLLIGVLVSLIGVALGAPFIMVLLVALTAAGLYGGHRKGTRIVSTPLPYRRRERRSRKAKRHVRQTLEAPHVL